MIITHLTSDLHFGHHNILKYAGATRPFSSVQEHDRVLIDNFNKYVKPTDVTLFVGDVSFHKPSQTQKILSQMHGEKILVLGNHDKGSSRAFKCGFSFVMQECVLYIAGYTVRVSHYPYWNEQAYRQAVAKSQAFDDRFKDKRPTKHEGECLIHGHTHSTKRLQGNMIHVGVDAWDLRPVSMLEVESLVKTIYK